MAYLLFFIVLYFGIEDTKNKLLADYSAAERRKLNTEYTHDKL